MPEVAQATITVTPVLKGAQQKLTDELTGAAAPAGESAGASAGENLAGSLMKKLTAAGIGTAVGKLALDGIKASVSNFADYEQLVGGVETLFKSSAGTVQKYAANAYKTAGLSANQYMETVTSFSASLLQSLGGNTEKAAKMADMAITDMADNANKMGTSMESIQNAYQGFAKQNYTMLDNLKLGYGGTKSEMERLLADAEEIKAAQGEVASYSIDSYADVVEAIHVVQDEMGITGTTSREAASTIEGSMNSAKAAWDNWLTAAADGNADLEAKTDELAESVVTAIENIAPVAIVAVENIGKAILELPDTIQRVEAAMRVDKLMGDTDDVAERFRIAAKNVDDLAANLQTAMESGEDTFYWRAELEKAQMVLEKLREESSGEIFDMVTAGEMDAAEGADLLGISTEQMYRQMRGAAEEARRAAAENDELADSAQNAAGELDEEAQKAKDTHDAIMDIAYAAIDARGSGDDLREAYNDLSKELETLRDEGNETDIMLAEQKLAMLDLAATNQELVDGLSEIPGAMDYASGYTVQLSQALIDAGLTADDYVSSVASMRDGVVNSFKVIADESSITAAEMGDALSSNLETMQQWGTDLEDLWAQAYANQDTAVMQYISYLSDLGPEYATAVHDFASGGYDELQSQAQDFADVGELSAKYTAEGIAAKAYLSSDEMGTLASDALAEYENQDFTQPGANSASDLAQGISSNAYLANSAMDSLVSDTYNAASSKTSDFYWVGYAMDTELASGLKAGSNAVTEAAKTVAKRAYDAAMSALKSKASNSGATENSIQSIDAYTFNAVPAPVPEQNQTPVWNNYFTVNGTENPEDYAVRLARTLQLQMRMS